MEHWTWRNKVTIWRNVQMNVDDVRFPKSWIYWTFTLMLWSILEGFLSPFQLVSTCKMILFYRSSPLSCPGSVQFSLFHIGPAILEFPIFKSCGWNIYNCFRLLCSDLEFPKQRFFPCNKQSQVCCPAVCQRECIVKKRQWKSGAEVCFMSSTWQ